MDHLNKFMLVAAALALVACAAPQQAPESADDAVQVEPETEATNAEQDSAGSSTVEENVENAASTDVASSSSADQSSSAAADQGTAPAAGSAAEDAAEEETSVEPDPVVRPTLPAQLQGAEQLLEQKSFFFDFDMEALKDDAFDALDAHAIAIGLAIAENPGVVVTIEGHADERGTQEYNIALGMRRAEAVSRYLRAKGIPAANLSTVSFGEAKPLELGSDEVSWAANRRAILDY